MNSIYQYKQPIIPYSNSQQNIANLNNYNYLGQNINYPSANSMNSISISQQQNINPNLGMIAVNNSLSQVPTIYSQNSSLNSNVLTGNQYLPNKNTNINIQSNISSSKNIDIKRGKISSSGSLLESTRANKFNTVIKDGKKIRNIDINDDCQDTKNEDDTESIVSPNYPGQNSNVLGQNNQILQNSEEEFALMPLDSDEIPN